MDKKEALKLLGIAATAGVAAAGAYAYIQYRKAQMDAEAARLCGVLALKPGARVGDIGAGVGNMSVRMAQSVGSGGKVYAVEIEKRNLGRLRKRKDKEDLSNIEIVACVSDNCNLPPNSCDALFVRGAYHHFADPAGMNRSLLLALRPGGTLAVIDFPPRLLLKPWTPKGIPANRGGHGIPRQIAEAELEAAGFELVHSIRDWPGGHFCILLQKPIAL